MEFQIEKTQYECHLGIGAMEKLDNKYKTQIANTGQSLGIAMAMIPAKYEASDPSLILDILSSADYTSPKKPTEKQLEAWINTKDEEELNQLFDEVYDFFSTAPVVRFRMKRMAQK